MAFTYFHFCYILQIWSLAVGKKTEMLVTGGTDALINFWHDSTAADKQEAFLREVSQICLVLHDSNIFFCPCTLLVNAYCFLQMRFVSIVLNISIYAFVKSFQC